MNVNFKISEKEFDALIKLITPIIWFILLSIIIKFTGLDLNKIRLILDAIRKVI